MSVADAYCRARNAESAVAYDTLGGTELALVVSGAGATGVGAALATGCCWTGACSFDPPQAARARAAAAARMGWIRGRSMANLHEWIGAWRRTGLTSPAPWNGKRAARSTSRAQRAAKSARRIQLGA